MKKIIAVLFMIAPYISMAQLQELNGGVGVRFGLPIDSIKYVMQQKHADAKFNDKIGTTIFYEGGKFAGRNVIMWVFKTSKVTGVHTIIIHLNNEESEVYNSFDSMTELMDKKYGEHTSIENYQWPYTADDKYKYGSTMFRAGKASLQNIWSFQGSNFDNRDIKNYIAVEINDKFSIEVTYQDGARVNKAVELKNNANMSDL